MKGIKNKAYVSSSLPASGTCRRQTTLFGRNRQVAAAPGVKSATSDCILYCRNATLFNAMCPHDVRIWNEDCQILCCVIEVKCSILKKCISAINTV